MRALSRGSDGRGRRSPEVFSAGQRAVIGDVGHEQLLVTAEVCRRDLEAGTAARPRGRLAQRSCELAAQTEHRPAAGEPDEHDLAVRRTRARRRPCGHRRSATCSASSSGRHGAACARRSRRRHWPATPAEPRSVCSPRRGAATGAGGLPAVVANRRAEDANRPCDGIARLPRARAAVARSGSSTTSRRSPNRGDGNPHWQEARRLPRPAGAAASR